jgi:biopolymer transport protein ExbD
MRLARARLAEASVDLTPMVDVVLLLVVFFMLTTQFARQQQTQLELPEQPGEKAREALRSAMVIDLTADGSFIIMGAQTSLAALRQEVERERLNAGAAFEVIVRADRAASASHLNALADTLARSGVRHWQLATSAGGGPRPAPDGAGAGAGGGS